MATQRPGKPLFLRIFYLFCLVLKLFGLIPIQLDHKHRIARQHLPSLVYSVVVILLVVITYPLARIYIFLELVDLGIVKRYTFVFLLGVVNGIILTLAVVVILIQTITGRHSLADYFCQRYNFMDRLGALGFQSTAEKHTIWLFWAMMWKILFGLMAKLCSQFFIMRSMFGSDDLSWFLNFTIFVTLIPLFVINLSRNLIFEGVMLLTMLMEFARKDTVKRLATVVKRNNIRTQSHQVWDIIDHLSILCEEIFELKEILIRFSSFPIIIMIVQEMINMTVQIYLQYSQYVWLKAYNVSISTSSFLISFQLIVGFIDFIITVSACQMLLQKVGGGIACVAYWNNF